jgi:hypothetical protein
MGVTSVGRRSGVLLSVRVIGQLAQKRARCYNLSTPTLSSQIASEVIPQCVERWCGLKQRASGVGLAPNAHGSSILRVCPPATR